jgi:hypothetical protein
MRFPWLQGIQCRETGLDSFCPSFAKRAYSLTRDRPSAAEEFESGTDHQALSRMEREGEKEREGR